MKFGLDDSLIEKINNIFSNYSEVEEVIIYGSRSKGNFRIGSDVDLTIIGKGFNYNKLDEILIKIDELNTPYKFDISIYSELLSEELIDHIKRIGQTFYKP